MAYGSKGYWDAKEQVDKDIGLDKKPTPKEITPSDSSLNPTNFPHMKKLSMSDEFKIKRIGGHQKVDLHQNSQWPASKSTPKQASNKDNTKKETEKPTQQPSCSKLPPNKNLSNLKNTEDNKESQDINTTKPSLKDKILTQINNNKIQLSNFSEHNYTKLYSFKQYKGKKEQLNISI